MKKTVFLVGANDVNAGCQEAIRQLRAVCVECRLIVIGNRPQVDSWEAVTTGDQDEIIVPNRLRRGATLALFGIVAADLLHEPDAAEWEWWLIGNLRALDEIASRAQERGVDAEAYESLTPDEVQAHLDKRGSYSQAMRELFVELKARAGETPIHVGNFAEESIRRWPELRRHELRQALFGGKKFSKIADEIGLVRKHNELLRLANPDSVVHISCG